MADYYLRKWGDTILRQECRPVKDFSDLDELLGAMESIWITYSVMGISAPQVGDDRQVIIAGIDGCLQTFVNPAIKKSQGYVPFLERCSSFPGLVMPKIRNHSIDLEYQTETGEKRNETYKGLNAIVLQHEIDHLRGKLIFHLK